MRRTAWLVLCLVMIALMGASGCELIATVDRSQIDNTTSTGGGGGSDGGSGGLAGGGSGGAPECLDASECPGSDTDCRLITCILDVCGSDDAALDTTCDDDGGQVCDGAGQCVECNDTTQCSGTDVCDTAANVCVPPPCLDGVLNNLETDVDCGGIDCAPCINGLMCALAGDCESGFCSDPGGGLVCTPCSADTDCQTGNWCDTVNGNVCASEKIDGDPCDGDNECQSTFCADGLCCDSACDGTCEACDSVGTEGACTPYAQGTDPEVECALDVCSGGSSCQCGDLALDGNETDVDCGGDVCPACAVGQMCSLGSDCQSGVCSAGTCAPSSCGDGVLQAGENCDDGNQNNNDDCPDGVGGTCQPAICGDGFVDGQGGVTEGCDGDGAGNPGETATCNASCTVSACGDGAQNVTAGEGCDDGNASNDDDCPDGVGGTCQPATCGDGFVDGQGGVTEGCDGNGLGVGGETATCNANCTISACGDGVQNVTAGEGCDDGDGLNTDDCPDGVGGTCQPATCGDGFVDGEGGVTEMCDGDGAGSGGETAACNLDCTPSACGDGTLNTTAGEQCDDGNIDNSDDCPDDTVAGGSCQDATCGDGFAHTAGGGTETDVDCGGTCPGCMLGQMCGADSDCASGLLCDGSLCIAAQVLSTTPADASVGVSVNTTIAVTFNTAMLPASLTSKTTLDSGPCSGSIQLSTDSFTTCVPFSSAAAAMSAGDTVATLTPAPGLSFGDSFQIRVTTAAQAAGGVALATPFTTATGFTTVVSQLGVVISQVYGGGGNSGATYTHDFIELHNRGTTSVDITGWAVQYASAAGSSWAPTVLTGILPAGGYYLIQMAAGAGAGVALPTPDLIGTTAMGASAGKVALTNTTTALTGTCPLGGAVVDFVGYGTTANCFEGSGPTPAPSAANSVQRAGGGCTDADDNASDFTALVAAARNSATGALTCTPPTVNETGNSLEADYCVLQFPTSISMTSADTTTVYGRIFEAGVTEAAGDSGLVVAEIGYGPPTANPQHEAGWTFVPATFNMQFGNDDEYQADLATLPAGSYGYVFRVSLDGGASFTYCDIDGAGSDAGLTFETTQIASMLVTP